MRRFRDSYLIPIVLAQPSAMLVGVALLSEQRGHSLAALVLLCCAAPMMALLRVRD